MCHNPLAYIFSSSSKFPFPNDYHLKLSHMTSSSLTQSIECTVYKDSNSSSEGELFSQVADERLYIKVHLFFFLVLVIKYRV